MTGSCYVYGIDVEDMNARPGSFIACVSHSGDVAKLNQLQLDILLARWQGYESVELVQKFNALNNIIKKGE